MCAHNVTLSNRNDTYNNCRYALLCSIEIDLFDDVKWIGDPGQKRSVIVTYVHNVCLHIKITHFFIKPILLNILCILFFALLNVVNHLFRFFFKSWVMWSIDFLLFSDNCNMMISKILELYYFKKDRFFDSEKANIHSWNV